MRAGVHGSCLARRIEADSDCCRCRHFGAVFLPRRTPCDQDRQPDPTWRLSWIDASRAARGAPAASMLSGSAGCQTFRCSPAYRRDRPYGCLPARRRTAVLQLGRAIFTYTFAVANAARIRCPPRLVSTTYLFPHSRRLPFLPKGRTVAGLSIVNLHTQRG
jgi:hypothetical protein